MKRTDRSFHQHTVQSPCQRHTSRCRGEAQPRSGQGKIHHKLRMVTKRKKKNLRGGFRFLKETAQSLQDQTQETEIPCSWVE